MKKKDQPPIPQNYVYSERPAKYAKKCKYCKQVIDKKASICPYCKRQQPVGCLGWILVILITAIAMGAVIYYGLNMSQ